ncbi:MAG: hypothetical protein LBN95_14030 [Prevotellaceae bacterium]|jgi:hypothetical protein|nr:hypothetical protein [Prevotellaceae bacterium]
MKKAFIIFIAFLGIQNLVAQDKIITKDAKQIDAKIIEVNEKDLKYNLNGQDYTILKADITTVIYQNGSVDVFDEETTTDDASQLILFPTKKGVVLLYENIGGKGGSTITTTNVEGSGDNFIVDYKYSTDIIGTKYGKIIIRNGIVESDIFTGMEGVKVLDGTVSEYPANMKPGQTLKESVCNVKYKGVKLKMYNTNRRCTAIEEITVEAGTFKCYKIEETQIVGTKIFKDTYKVTGWYAHGIGMIRTISYHEQSQVQVVSELKSITLLK